MPRKTIIIFITVFLLVGAILMGIYFYNKSRGVAVSDPNASLYQKFNPFGTSTKTTTTDNTGTTENPVTETVTKENSKFYQITDFAIAGATFVDDTRPVTNKDDTQTPDSNVTTVNKPTAETAPAVRYVERMNGHVYRMFLDTKTKEQISNLTIPSIYEVFFNDKANTIIYRYLSQDDTINSLILNIESSNKEFLPQNISDLSVSLDKKNLFYLIKKGSGSVGIVRSFDNPKESIVFNSPFTEWLPQWTSNQNIFLTNKPFYSIDGSIFLLNTLNKTLSKVFGRIAGLTTLVNANETLILYSLSTSSGPTLNVFDVKKHESIDLGKYGLPEKCVWSKNNMDVYCAIPNVIEGNQYPNSWYQGLNSFTDYFVKINTNTKDVVTIANSQGETPIDATNLFLNKDEDKLFFTNKKDSTFWSLEI